MVLEPHKGQAYQHAGIFCQILLLFNEEILEMNTYFELCMIPFEWMVGFTDPLLLPAITFY